MASGGLAKGYLQRRDLAADPGLPADGARRRRDGDAVIVGGPHPPARDARLAEQEKSRFGIGHDHTQHGADRDRLWALLSRIGNRTALDELDPHRRRFFAAFIISGSYFPGETRIALARQAVRPRGGAERGGDAGGGGVLDETSVWMHERAVNPLPSPSFPICFGDRLRLYLDPWPSGPDARREAQPLRCAQGLSSGLLRQATSNCVERQARRGADTTIPYHDSLLGRSWAAPWTLFSVRYAR